jgi:hypothetical protein
LVEAKPPIRDDGFRLVGLTRDSVVVAGRDLNSRPSGYESVDLRRCGVGQSNK